MTEGGASGYRRLVANNPNFRHLWVGEIVSLLGDWFNLIASATLVAQLSGTAASAIGLLFVVRMLAPFLTGPFGGVLADRMDRRRLLIATDLIRAVVVAGFLLVRDPGQVPLLYALTAVQLGVTGFWAPARNAILPELVARGDVGAANALTSATWSVMLAFGAALGGVVAGAYGIYPAFAIDSVTFLVSALFVSRIAYRPATRTVAVATTGASAAADVFGGYVAGLGYLRGNRDILAITLHKFAVAITVSGPLQVLQVALAQRVYAGSLGLDDSEVLGLFYAVVGVGTGIGPIVARAFTGDRHRALRRAIAGSYLVSALGLLLVARLPGLGLSLVGFALRGFGGGLIWVFSTQLLLDLVPDRVRGRVFGTEFALFTLANAVGAAVTGWAVDTLGLGLGSVIALFGWATLVPGALWVAWMLAGETASPPEG